MSKKTALDAMVDATVEKVLDVAYPDRHDTAKSGPSCEHGFETGGEKYAPCCSTCDYVRESHNAALELAAGFCDAAAAGSERASMTHILNELARIIRANKEPT